MTRKSTAKTPGNLSQKNRGVGFGKGTQAKEIKDRSKKVVRFWRKHYSGPVAIGLEVQLGQGAKCQSWTRGPTVGESIHDGTAVYGTLPEQTPKILRI